MNGHDPYRVSFSLNVIHHLGDLLYSNVPAVLSELVANAHDAAATRVAITITPEHVEILDNGRGMSRADINDRYLRIGYQKRRDEFRINVGDQERHVMGRKGIGKLSALSIAHQVEIQTTKEGEKNGFILSSYDIDRAIENNDDGYSPIPLRTDHINLEQGTRIILRDLQRPIEGVEAELRTSLARRFTLLEGDVRFQIVLNGRPITLLDRKYFDKIKYIWYLGEDGKKYADLCKNKVRAFELDGRISPIEGQIVSGWIGTTFLPTNVDKEHRTLSIYAHRKLIIEDMITSIRDAQQGWGYLLGDVEADFMDADDKPDIITTSRQNVVESDPRYVALRAFLWRETRKILRARTKVKPKEEEAAAKAPASKQSDLFDEQGDTVPSSKDAPHQTEAEAVPSPSASEPTPQASPPPSTNNDSIDGAPLPTATDASRNSPEAGYDSLRAPRLPSRDTQNSFNRIRALVRTSSLEQEFQNVILYDLDQAEWAYGNNAYKAGVVMLGAVLEAVMLGTLRRPDVLDDILSRPNVPKILNKLPGGPGHPSYADRSVLADAVANERFQFEDYRQIIEWYLPQITELRPITIQQFRNTIHPWQSIQQPAAYDIADKDRAAGFLNSLAVLAKIILQWKPKIGEE